MCYLFRRHLKGLTFFHYLTFYIFTLSSTSRYNLFPVINYLTLHLRKILMNYKIILCEGQRFKESLSSLEHRRKTNARNTWSHMFWEENAQTKHLVTHISPVCCGCDSSHGIKNTMCHNVLLWGHSFYGIKEHRAKSWSWRYQRPSVF